MRRTEHLGRGAACSSGGGFPWRPGFRVSSGALARSRRRGLPKVIRPRDAISTSSNALQVDDDPHLMDTHDVVPLARVRFDVEAVLLKFCR
jgi:hypothetical protein